MASDQQIKWEKCRLQQIFLLWFLGEPVPWVWSALCNIRPGRRTETKTSQIKVRQTTTQVWGKKWHAKINIMYMKWAQEGMRPRQSPPLTSAHQHLHLIQDYRAVTWSFTISPCRTSSTRHPKSSPDEYWEFLFCIKQQLPLCRDQWVLFLILGSKKIQGWGGKSATSMDKDEQLLGYSNRNGPAQEHHKLFLLKMKQLSWREGGNCRFQPLE